MKFLLLVLSLIVSIPSWANQTGLGVSLGSPTGLNAKHWLSSSQAVDGGLGFSILGRSDLQIHSDFLLHNEGALYFNDNHPLDLYYGIGGRIKFAEDIILGARIPVGVVHKFENENADVFGEIAPVIDLIGKVGLEIHLLFGARFYFQ